MQGSLQPPTTLDEVSDACGNPDKIDGSGVADHITNVRVRDRGMIVRVNVIERIDTLKH